VAALPATGEAAPAVGVNTAGTSLLLFHTATPGTMTPVPITGLGAGETIEGIDRRPSTGGLYGLGVVDTGPTDSLRLYRIDPTTGAATAVGVAPVMAPTDGTDYGVDFNPLVDRVRVVNDGNENLRLNPTTARSPATIPTSRTPRFPTAGRSKGSPTATTSRRPSDPAAASA
jgi:Domain of unknown function (DUF4394)